MNIYKLNGKEVNELRKEFENTYYGFKAKLAAALPTIGFVAMIILYVLEIFSADFQQREAELIPLFVVCMVTCCFLGITRLQYWNMLKDYAESKVEPKKSKK